MSLVQVISANADKNLAAEVSVLAWTSPNQPGLGAELAVEIRAGDGAKNIAGAGVYVLRAVVASQEVFRAEVYVAAGVTRRTFWCPSIPIGQAELLTVYLTGLAADGDVDVTAILHERTEDQAIGRAELGVGRCWFVSKDGADANSGGSWLAARLTVAAITGDGAFDNDHGIWFGPGIWTEAVALTGYDGIVLRALCRRRTTLTAATGKTLELCAHARVLGMVIVDTKVATGVYLNFAIYAAGAGLAPLDSVLIEDCLLVSTDTGGWFRNCPNLRIVGTDVNASESAIMASDGTEGVFEDGLATVADWTMCNSLGIVFTSDDLPRQFAVRRTLLRGRNAVGGPVNQVPKGISVGGIGACVLVENCDIAVEVGTLTAPLEPLAGITATNYAIVDVVNSAVHVRPYDDAGDPLPAGHYFDLYADADSEIRVAETAYDPARTAGPITQAPPGAAILADTNELQSLGVKLSAQGKADVDQAVGRRGGATIAWFIDSDTGDDGNAGRSWADAMKTFGGAAGDGDFGDGTSQTVFVSGDLAESDDIASQITVETVGSEWLYNGVGPYVVQLGQRTTVRGFHLKRAAATGAIVTSTGDCVVEDCVLEATGGAKAALGVAGDVIILRRCIITGPLDATAGTIVLDACRRVSGSDTGTVVYTGDIASREASGAAAAAAALIRGGTRTLEDLATPEAGSGDVLVDHDTGGADNLRATTGGVGVDGATIRAYTKADYDAGVHTVRGEAVTGSDGRWVAPMYLDADTYVFVFAKPGVLRSKEVAVTVA